MVSGSVNSSPSTEAHLGNDFLEPSVDQAVPWIVGDDRSAVLGAPCNVIATALDNVIGFDLHAEKHSSMCYETSMCPSTVRYNYPLTRLC